VLRYDIDQAHLPLLPSLFHGSMQGTPDHAR